MKHTLRFWSSPFSQKSFLFFSFSFLLLLFPSLCWSLCPVYTCIVPLPPPARRVPPNSTPTPREYILHVGVRACVLVYVCARACVPVYVCACVCVDVWIGWMCRSVSVWMCWFNALLICFRTHLQLSCSSIDQAHRRCPFLIPLMSIKNNKKHLKKT